MTRYEKILEALRKFNTEEIVILHNMYCEACNDMDSYVYYMEEFNDIMEDYAPNDLARTIFYGDFRPNDDYFRFNGYANLESFNYYDEETSGIYLEDIARYCNEAEENFGYEEIENIFLYDEELDNE